jgi:hypothetical protein
MAKKRIKSIAGLQRAWNAHNKRFANLSRRQYILRPALSRHLARLDSLTTIGNDDARYQAFRCLPSLDFELQEFDAGLSPKQRISLAQQDRAKRIRIRLTADGETLETVIHKVLADVENPWQHPAKHFWLLTADYLLKLGLKPTTVMDSVDPSKEKLEYECDGGRRRSLTMGQFENRVSEVRRRLTRGLN